MMGRGQFRPAHVFPVGDGNFYLAERAWRAAPGSRCDGCGRLSVRGFVLYYLGAMDRCENTGAWGCGLDCTLNNINDQEGGSD